MSVKLVSSVNPSIDSTQTCFFIWNKEDAHWRATKAAEFHPHVVVVSVKTRIKLLVSTTAAVDGGNVLPPHWSAIHYELLVDGYKLSVINRPRFQKLLPLQTTGICWGFVAGACSSLRDFQSGFFFLSFPFKQNAAPVSRAAAVL